MGSFRLIRAGSRERPPRREVISCPTYSLRAWSRIKPTSNFPKKSRKVSSSYPFEFRYNNSSSSFMRFNRMVINEVNGYCCREKLSRGKERSFSFRSQIATKYRDEKRREGFLISKIGIRSSVVRGETRDTSHDSARNFSVII